MDRRSFFTRLVGGVVAMFGVKAITLDTPPEFVTFKKLSPEEVAKLRRHWEAYNANTAGLSRYAILMDRGTMTINEVRAQL